MTLLRKIGLAIAVAMSIGLAGCGKHESAPAPEPVIPVERKLYIYNWTDYIDESVLKDFSRETGIKVVYDVFDSNEVLEAKLLSGNTGFDLVVPSGQFLGRQVQAGVFQKLDRSQLPNWKNLDPKFLKMVEGYDPGNQYALPYLWGTTGFGYNVAKLKAALGEDYVVDSWDAVFKPEVAAKLKDCGLTMLGAQSEMMPLALNYIGRNPSSHDEADFIAAGDLLTQVRPFIRYFHSSQYVNDLANGDICIAVGWSGDIFMAESRAKEAHNGVELAYLIPKEGSEIWFDAIAIPKDAKHVAEAHEFLNYLLRPRVIAKITNVVSYANPNPASLEFVDEAVRTDPAIYPPDEVMAKLYMTEIMPNDVDRMMTRIWTKVESGK